MSINALWLDNAAARQTNAIVVCSCQPKTDQTSHQAKWDGGVFGALFGP